MSRATLLAIVSSPQDNELIIRHWPYFKMTGFTILGCGTEDGKCDWPEPVLRLDTGKIGVRQTPAGSAIFGLVRQELDIWRWFVNHPEYESVCVIEADGVFVRKPPERHPGGPYLVSLVPNFSRQGLFKTGTFFQTPRWSDRHTTECLLNYGAHMLQIGETENYMSDRWPAWICYKNHIEFMPFPAWTPFSFPQWAGMSEAEHKLRSIRIAIQCGCIYLHSIKTSAELKVVEDTMTECGLLVTCQS